MNGSVHIGTSGWSYKHWRVRFYPEGTVPGGYLRYYARHFSCTEINTSFYHLPRPDTVTHWADSVAKSFRFCPKISRYITHIKKLLDPEETLPKFFDLFEPVRKRLGPVLIQLPPSLAFDEDREKPFYEALKKYKGYRFALEPRHESWLSDRSLSLLEKYRIAFVIADSGGRHPSGEFVTARHIYLRFHGRGGFDKGYSDKALRKVARKIKDWREGGHAIWVFFNNDGNAWAVRNALTLQSLTA